MPQVEATFFHNNYIFSTWAFFDSLILIQRNPSFLANFGLLLGLIANIVVFTVVIHHTRYYTEIKLWERNLVFVTTNTKESKEKNVKYCLFLLRLICQFSSQIILHVET